MSPFFSALANTHDETFTGLLNTREEARHDGTAVNFYFRELISLVQQMQTGSSDHNDEPAHMPLDTFYQTLLEPSNASTLHVEHALALVSQHVKITLGYASLFNTEVGVFDIIRNSQSAMMLFHLQFPCEFPGKLLAWHKDILLDIADARPQQELQRLKFPSQDDPHSLAQSYNFYAAQPAENFFGLLTTTFFNALQSLLMINGQNDLPSDFALSNNNLAIVIRSVPGPFFCSINKHVHSTLSSVLDDLFTIHQHILVAQKIGQILSDGR